MDVFNPVNYCEDLLRVHEIVSLASLEKALHEVKQEIDAQKSLALESIERIQKSIYDKGGLDISRNLLERKERASKDLELARVLAKGLNRDYEETSRVLDEKEMQKKNGILLKDLVIELDHYNLNQVDIEVDPRHIIYLKHALETLDLPEFNTVIAT